MRKSLEKAMKAKNDEFYTLYKSIEGEVQSYVDFNSDVFRDKVIYCNCDNPYKTI